MSSEIVILKNALISRHYTLALDYCSLYCVTGVVLSVIVCWYKVLYQVSPLLVVTATRNDTGSHNRFDQHTVYVMSIYSVLR